MARPERHDADYFPFYARDGRTLFILESKYQCKGTGFFTNVMRFLTLQADHHFCIKAPEDRLYFFSKCKCDEVSGADMLDMMSVTGKIDKELWVSGGVIVSQDLLTSLSDAYRKRLNNIITIAEIKQKCVSGGSLPVSGGSYTQADVVSGVDNPQRKGKERKGKETKEDFVLPEWMPRETWQAYLDLRDRKKAAKTTYALKLIIKELERIKTTHRQDPVAVLNKSIKSGWIDVYPLKEDGKTSLNKAEIRSMKNAQALTEYINSEAQNG